MRLIGPLQNEKKAYRFSEFLFTQGIENECEIIPKPEGPLCHIWIYDEDQYEQAKVWWEKFEKNPEDLSFTPKPQEPPPPPPPPKDSRPPDVKAAILAKAPVIRRKVHAVKSHRIGFVTLFLLVLCVAIFLRQETTAPPQVPVALPSYINPLVPHLAPIQTKLLFDFPESYELMQKLLRLYTPEQLQHPETGPLELQLLIKKLQNTPYWTGLYPKLTGALNFPNSKDFTPPAPLFEKIKKGEVWRLFTPALLHADLFHILFNILWLIVLGAQIEKRLGWAKYLFFVILTGILSNLAEYAMAGPNFLGLSGIICAMVGFIWARQRKAPWEGYLLHRSTLIFIAIYVLAMLGIQVVSFILEAYGASSIAPGIANTAHLVGALVGFLLGQGKFFGWHPKHNA